MSDKAIRIKPFFTIIAHSPDFIEFRSGVWNHVSYTVQDQTSSGKLYQFVNLLDGNTKTSEIAKSINMSTSEAEGIIDHLWQLNVIEDKASSAFDYYTDIYTPLFKNYQNDAKNILNKKIAIISNNSLGNEIKHALINNTPLINIELIDQDNKIIELLNNSDQTWLHNAIAFEEMLQRFEHLSEKFVVLATDLINPVFMKKFNRVATALNLHWIHAAIDGPFVYIGPLFEANQSACYECFETRISMNLREYHSYQRYKSALIENQIIRQSEFPMNKMIHSMMISHLTFEIFNYIVTNNCFTKNKVLSIYLPTMEIVFNEFIKVSTCHNCGSQPHRDDHQLYFDVQSLLRDHHD